MTRRRSGALALCIGVVLALAGGAPAVGQENPSTDADDTTGEPGEPDEPPTLTLADRSPWVAPDGPLDLVLETTGDVSSAVVEVRVGSTVEDPDQLRASLEADIGRRVYGSLPIPLGLIPPQADGTRLLRFETSVGPADGTIRLREPGVYPVTVTLEASDGTLLDEVRTPVVRLGSDDDPLPAPALAVVVDVDAGPSVDPDGSREVPTTELARLGRLGELLALRPPDEPAPPLTLSVVPDTIDALTATADPRAEELVGQLADLDGRLALGRPYVDLSVQSVLDARLDGFLPGITNLGRAVLADRLSADVDGSTWVLRDGLQADGAASLAELGVRRVLVDSSLIDIEPGDDAGASDDPDDRELIPAGPRPISDLAPLEAVLVDAGTTEALLSPAADRPDAPHLALADLLVRPGAEDRTVVVAVTDAPDDAALLGLVPLLALPGSPVTIGGLELVDGASAAGADPVSWPAVDVPDLAPFAGPILRVSGAIDSFASTLVGESARADELRLRIATVLSRDLESAERSALIDAVDDTVSSAFAGITLAGQTDLNLTSRSGTLPIIVQNTNGYPIRVVVTMQSERLEFPDGERFEVVVEEDAVRLDVPVRARATGSVPTFVTLTTPDGEIELDARQLNVRSTAISGVGLAISLGALAVLLVWWGRSWWRSRRNVPDAGAPAGE